MNKSDIENYISFMGFSLITGTTGQWKIDKLGYELKIDLDGDQLNNWTIDYGNEITVHSRTTSNFSKLENIVVLECVLRLLEKGYPAKRIELEKNWRVGGRLDIYVKGDNDLAYLMIECKTWGNEYNKAIKITLENNVKKEQILNYFVQDRSAQYLCIYTSQLNLDNEYVYLSSIIDATSLQTGNNQQEVYDLWDKVFYSKGIFESTINPYDIEFQGIKKRDLKPIDHSLLSTESKNEGSIFNRFAEILRRHTISDQSNAYNKIFNLFLCKIVDEDNARTDAYEMQFQWKYNEKSVDVIYRLSDLYKKGMKDYMKLDIADVSESDFNDAISNIDPANSQYSEDLRRMFIELRLYKNNEFSFKEVINSQTFEENAEIVKEVVKLLEHYKIKYEHKQRFLGDFFERLLNIGVKQASGQFFTPLPITTFISHSIPFEKIINDKIESGQNDFLPYIIDFACGSGHFLNDAMDRVDKIIQTIDTKIFKTDTQENNFNTWKIAYKWAKDFIYGIEKDYRLAKTTKVACFLNGDGEAEIVFGDGLAPFSSSFYSGKLHSSSTKMENPVFDVIMANPPFSVENFKMVLKEGNKTFNIFENIGDNSDDIECLFVERTYQLLKEGGYVGIILPSTLLLNKGLHQKSRKIILDNFRIYGICELGTKTFTYAGQPTIALFMKKLSKKEKNTVSSSINNFLKRKKDFDYEGHKNVISDYISRIGVYSDLEEFIDKLDDAAFKKVEIQKINYFLLNIKSKVVVGNSLSGEEMKLFLGYEHSSITKYEGIHPYPHNTQGKIISKLYDEDNLHNPEKLSTLIYKNFLGQQLSIPASLSKHVEVKSLIDMMDFSNTKFEQKIYLQNLKNPFLDITNHRLVSLSDNSIAVILDNQRKPVKKSKRKVGNFSYYGASGEIGKIDSYIFDGKYVLIGEDGAKWSKGESTAYIIEGKSWVNNHAHVIQTTNELLEEFLVLVFNRLDFSYLKTRPNGGKLQKGELVTIKFPLPSIERQREIVCNVSLLSGMDKWDSFDELLRLEGT